MSSIFDGVGAVKEAVVRVVNAVAGLPDAIWGLMKKTLTAIENALIGLPMQILDGIRGIFIPEVGYIDNAFKEFVADLKMKFNFDTDFFESVAVGGSPVEDIEGGYYVPGVGSMQLTFFNTQYLRQGVEYFRPFIRGFLVLLMAFYNVKQVLGFIRQDAGVVAGKGSDIAEGKGGKK